MEIVVAGSWLEMIINRILPFDLLDEADLYNFWSRTLSPKINDWILGLSSFYFLNCMDLVVTLSLVSKLETFCWPNLGNNWISCVLYNRMSDPFSWHIVIRLIRSYLKTDSVYQLVHNQHHKTIVVSSKYSADSILNCLNPEPHPQTSKKLFETQNGVKKPNDEAQSRK